MYCNKCGNQIPDNSAVCPYCGSPVEGQTVAQNVYGAQQGYVPQPQQPVGYPQTPPPTGQVPGKGQGIASLVLGIIGIALAWFSWVNIATLACSIIGIALGYLARKHSTEALGRPYGIATAGLVLSIIATVLNSITLFTCTICPVACTSCTWASLF